jgi:hypothetical protein
MSKKKAKASNDTHSDHAGVRVRKEVRMKYVFPSEIKPMFANHMIVQSDESTTYLSFFSLQPPVVIGDEEEVKKQIDDLTEVRAHLVTQVVIPRDRLKNFVEVMASTINANPILKALDHSHSDTSARLT